METWEGQIVLQAGLAAEVNVSLRVGAASTQVTVGDVTTMIDTSTPTISERLDRSRIEQFLVSDAMGLVASTGRAPALTAFAIPPSKPGVAARASL